jgi:hypothetical protein
LSIEPTPLPNYIAPPTIYPTPGINETAVETASYAVSNPFVISPFSPEYSRFGPAIADKTAPAAVIPKPAPAVPLKALEKPDLTPLLIDDLFNPLVNTD